MSCRFTGVLVGVLIFIQIGILFPQVTATTHLHMQETQLRIINPPTQVDELAFFNFTVRLINGTEYDSFRVFAIDSNDITHNWNREYFNTSLEIFDTVITIRLRTPGINDVYVEASSSTDNPLLVASFTVFVIAETETDNDFIYLMQNPFMWIFIVGVIVALVYLIAKRFASKHEVSSTPFV